MAFRLQTDYRAKPLEFALDYLRKTVETFGVSLVLTIKTDSTIPAQGYALTPDLDGICLKAGDDSGFLYGALEIADHIRAYRSIDRLPEGITLPHILNRGVKLNVPLDARTPSYSDCGDSAQQNIETMWDLDFWKAFIDRMALARYNVLSLWNLCPFPSLVKVPGYPNAALDNVMISSYPANGTTRAMGFLTERMRDSLVTVKIMTIQEKIAFWQAVMAYAADRCVQMYLFTWNIYLYGLESSGYALTDHPGDAATTDYYMRSVEALVNTYPLLAGIGVTAGENMDASWGGDQDLVWVRNTYGKGIEIALENQPGRPFTLIQRSHMTTMRQMEQAFDGFKHNLEFSFKYSQAHMCTIEKPHFGDAFFESLKPGRKTWLTLRDDDFYTIPWFDLDFLNAYVAQMPLEKMSGFYMGADGIIWARDFQSRNPSLQGRMFIGKHWLTFNMMGQIGYHGKRGEAFVRGLLNAHDPNMPAELLLAAWQNASRPVPLFQRVYWNDFDFQWYPEACVSLDTQEQQRVFHSLEHVMSGIACPGTGYLSAAETSLLLAQNKDLPPHNALDTAAEMLNCCTRAQQALAALPAPQGAQQTELIGDIQRSIALGRYYAHKLTAAVYLKAYRLGGGADTQERAIAEAEKAYTSYTAYSHSTAMMYKPQRFTRLGGTVSADQFDGSAYMDILIARDGTRRE